MDIDTISSASMNVTYRRGFTDSSLLESISKNGFWFKIKAAANIKPEEYIGYFEDLI